MHHVAHLHGARGFFSSGAGSIPSQGVLRLVELPAHLGARGVDALGGRFSSVTAPSASRPARRNVLSATARASARMRSARAHLVLRLFEPDLKLGAQARPFSAPPAACGAAGRLGALAVDSRLACLSSGGMRRGRSK